MVFRMLLYGLVMSYNTVILIILKFTSALAALFVTMTIIDTTKHSLTEERIYPMVTTH